MIIWLKRCVHNFKECMNSTRVMCLCHIRTHIYLEEVVPKLTISYGHDVEKQLIGLF